MLPPLATVDDLRVRLPEGIPDSDVPRAEAALEDASALVRDECGGRSFLTEDGAVDAPDAVVRVVLAVARRDFLNPEGARTTTETVGPFTDTVSRPDSASSCYLTEDEKSVCQRYRQSSTSGLWTQSTTRGRCGSDVTWAYDQYGTEPLPIGVRGCW